MELYIIRHGKTYWNEEKRIQGWADIDLTESGRRVAVESAEGMKNIHFDAIYSSPLKRASDTAYILRGDRDLPVIVDERIKEIGFGELEGADFTKIRGDKTSKFASFFDAPEKYVAPEDMHVYSIDEVFMDVTPYLETYQMTARQLASVILQDVLDSTGITATAGIGTNLYLCKVAMDIVAKKIAPDRNGARIAELDEMRYRELLWTHRPLTDFWRVGSGYAKKLEANGLYTMGDIARCSIGKPYQTNNEDLLYRLFGVNAELLIDHAWGWEPCTIDAIKAYRPENFSMSNGQVLSCPYCFEKAKLVLREMLEAATLELVDQGRLTDQVVLTVGYDVENLGKPYAKGINTEEIKTDRYGRKVPKPAHGTANLKEKTASARQITEAVIALYDKIVNPSFSIRRLNISLNHLTDERDSTKIKEPQQLSLFVDYEAERARAEEEQKRLNREKQMQKAMIAIKKRYGKNAVLKGLNLQEGATGRNRNNQIGGHKA